MITVLILAAGKSSRMAGTDKLMLPVNGAPLLRKQIDIAHGIGPVFVALPPDNEPRLTALRGTNATPIIVDSAAEGIGGTLRGANQMVPEGDLMILLADLIDLEASDLNAVVQARHSYPENMVWRGISTDGTAGHPIIFHQQVRNIFNKLKGDTGAAAILKSLSKQTRMVSLPKEHAIRDIDTPADWDNWQAD